MTTLSGAGGTTFYIQQDGSNIVYSTNQSSWNTLSFPCTVQNNNTGAGVLTIAFTTNITLTTVNDYFVCDTTHLQFGSTSLNEDGSRPGITIDNVANYPGLIRNGTGSVAGNSNIYIYNLQVSSNSSTLASGGGWIGQEYFGKAVTENYIVNCTSDGDIPNLGGGIVGQGAGGSLINTPSELTLRGCSTSGSIGQYAGGIAGHYPGEGTVTAQGSIVCESCWSEGAIGQEGGGIFGDYGGINNGSAVARNCYSTGIISSYAGGIFGSYAGENTGQAFAETCYSRGPIQTYGGGIFGQYAGNFSGIVTATNCYSSGSISTSGTGIYGSNKQNGTTIHCYAAEGSWADSTATTNLQGAPNPTVGTVGNTWVSTGTNQPYELVEMGYTPYTIEIISANQLVRSYSQSIQRGQSTRTAVIADASGNQFIILKKADGDPTSYDSITINVQTGAITTTSNTIPGTYTITMRSTGSYHITVFTLTVSEVSADLPCCEKPLYVSKDIDYSMRYDLIAGNTLIGSTSVRRGPISYSDSMNLKRAYAAKR